MTTAITTIIDMAGQRVLVTGAASGIGAATVELLLASGAEVVSLDRSELPSTLAERVAVHVICDLTDVTAIDAAVASIDGEFDALCNIAGVPGTAPPATVIAVNVLALRHLTESIADRIRDGGSIVNVASIAGAGWPMTLAESHRLLATASFDDGRAWAEDQPMDGARAYNFSKEAVLVWSMSNSLRWWDRRIRVNCVSPGPVETPILQDFRDSMGADRIQAGIDLVGGAGQPDAIAPAIVFLASRMAPWVNGTNIVADGGLLGVSMSQPPA